MRFIFDLTRREIRSTWRSLLFFFLCIAIGVGSVVAIRSLIRNLAASVGTDARVLLTGDIEIGSSNDFSPGELLAIDNAISQFPIVDARHENVTAAVMARGAGQAEPAVKFIELKGVDGTFPLVGDFNLSDGRSFDASLLDDNGAIAAQIVLDDLKVKIGDKLRIGEGEFTIRGSFDEEPGGTQGIRLGGRIFVSRKGFESAGIIRNNGRVRRRIILRTTSDPTELTKQLRKDLEGTGVTLRNYKEQQENLSDQFTKTEDYLSLTGLLILVLGGVGVGNVAAAFIDQKRRTVAILKCVGASSARIISVYSLQIFSLSLIGSILGIALAQLTLFTVKWRFADVLPANMSYAVSGSIALQGIILGILISLAFSSLPLSQITEIKPKLLLKDDNNERLKRLSKGRLAVLIAALASIIAIAIWQAGSIPVGVVFLALLGVSCGALFAISLATKFVLRRLSRLGGFVVKQSIGSLYRPGNQTGIVLVAIGLGVFVVVGVFLIQDNLIRDLDFTRNSKLPSLFFVDIQRSQIDELEKLLTERSGESPQRLPTVRARIQLVNGQPIDYQNREIRQRQGQIGREFTVTYRAQLESNETVIAGKWWPSDNSDPQVSLEESLARDLKAKIGDSVTFDLSGRPVTAKVTSIRKLDLRNTRTAFLIVFPNSVISDAPQTYALSLLKHLPATDRQRIQRDVLDRFPNVQVFDVDDIMSTVVRLLRNFILAISSVGLFVMFSGVLILIGSIALSRSQRLYENAVLKTLGAGSGRLLRILTLEYLVLGFVAGISGSAFANLLAYFACRFLMKIDWEPNLFVTATGVLAATVIVAMTGVIFGSGVVIRRPLAVLRTQ